MERYRLLGIEHDGRESASARVVSREPNKWGVFPLHTFNSGDEVVLAADAQATIAALQARVRELEAIKIPDDAFTYCAYCGEKSPVDEHNEDLAAHIKVCPKHPMRDVEAQLTQRTAELEAAKEKAAEQGRYAVEMFDEVKRVQAELERVRGELATYKETKHDAI